MNEEIKTLLRELYRIRDNWAVQETNKKGMNPELDTESNIFGYCKAELDAVIAEWYRYIVMQKEIEKK